MQTPCLAKPVIHFSMSQGRDIGAFADQGSDEAVSSFILFQWQGQQVDELGQCCSWRHVRAGQHAGLDQPLAGGVVSRHDAPRWALADGSQ